MAASASASALYVTSSSSSSSSSTKATSWCHLSKLVTTTDSTTKSMNSSINKQLPAIRITCRFTRPHTNTSSTKNRESKRAFSSLEASTAAATTASVPVRVAHELLLAGHTYLDVRTPEEFSQGHVPGAVNIPYMLKVGSGMTLNPNFMPQVSSLFGKDDEILIGCQSGKRSLMAINQLVSAGYSGIIDVAGGYAAWNQTQLPTTASA